MKYTNIDRHNPILKEYQAKTKVESDLKSKDIIEKPSNIKVNNMSQREEVLVETSIEIDIA